MSYYAIHLSRCLHLEISCHPYHSFSHRTNSQNRRYHLWWLAHLCLKEYYYRMYLQRTSHLFDITHPHIPYHLSMYHILNLMMKQTIHLHAIFHQPICLDKMNHQHTPSFQCHQVSRLLHNLCNVPLQHQLLQKSGLTFHSPKFLFLLFRLLCTTFLPH